ncbi:MAG: hypothetical protein HY306_13535 [Nitrosomonadales bacterium]|nr:hypothetical protein [Nitrosomonadales bacterium]
MKPNRVATASVAYALFMFAWPTLASSETGLPPQFKDFPSEIVRVESKASPALKPMTNAWRFRTTIRESYADTPVNFAGHFVAISWGCGAPCQQWAIINAQTGSIYLASFSTGNGALFYTDSQLFVADPPDDKAESQSCDDDNVMCQLGRGDFAVYYRWTGSAFEELYKVSK